MLLIMSFIANIHPDLAPNATKMCRIEAGVARCAYRKQCLAIVESLLSEARATLLTLTTAYLNLLDLNSSAGPCGYDIMEN